MKKWLFFFKFVPGFEYLVLEFLEKSQNITLPNFKLKSYLQLINDLQGKKHQNNLARRAAKEAKDAPIQPAPEKARVDIKKFVKIGRPGYRCVDFQPQYYEQEQ